MSPAHGRPQPTRADRDQFCKTEGWHRVRDARGRHITYELDLYDGSILRTRVSHPPDRTDYGPGLWRHILRDQLRVDDGEFWACVRDGVLPDRGGPAVPAEALPADLVHLLITRVGVPESEIATLTRVDAVERLNRYWLGSA